MIDANHGLKEMNGREDKGYQTSGERIASNEAGFVRAGLHYSSTNEAGKFLAEIFQIAKGS